MENLIAQVAQVDSETNSNVTYLSETMKVNQTTRTQEEIQDWLVVYLAQLLEIGPDEIDITLSFDCYSLDSAAAVGLSGDLEEWLNCEFEPTLLYDYPTIESLATYLVHQS